jgi:uncharacterized membrane protein
MRPRLGDWLAPFKAESPYAGISAHESLFVRDLGPRLLVMFAVLIYAFHYGSFSMQRFTAFEQPGFDLGIFDQGIWLLSRFKEPFVTIMGLNLFGDHASYILLFFVPLYWIHASAQWLLGAQTLALATAAIPVYLLAKRFLGNPWLAVLPALAFLLNPALGWLNLENFHPDSFEVLLALLAFYCLVERRWRAYFVSLALLLLVKEDVAFLVVPLGIYTAVRYHRRNGLLIVYAGVLWFIVTVFFLGPLFSHDSAGSLDAFRIPFGGWKGLFDTAVTEPWAVLGSMLTSDKIKYVVQLLAPLFFLPLLSVETLLILPTLFFNLLSTFSYQYDIRYHYTSLIIPLLAWSSLAFLGRLRDRGTQRALVVLVLLAAVFSAYVWGPAAWSRQAPADYDANAAQVLALKEAVAMIPPGAVVSSRSRISSHLVYRDRIYDFPTPFYAQYYGNDSMDKHRLPEADQVQYVLDLPDHLSDVGAHIFTSLQQSEGFRVIYDKQGVVLLKKETRTTVSQDSNTGTDLFAPIYNKSPMAGLAVAG